MEPRGRGRATRGGRARAEPSQQQAMRPGGPPRGGGPQGAWARPPGPPQQQQRFPQQQQQQRPQGFPPQQPPQQQQGPPGGWGRQPQATRSQPQQPPPSAQPQGRGSRMGGDDGSVRPPQEMHIAAGSEPAALRDTTSKERGGGNGGVRGRTNRNEIIHTKPANMQSKQGSTGTPIHLTANFFKLMNKPDWCLHQYRVDFNPEVDDTRSRRKMVQIAFKHENDIGGFLFDGTVMYTALRLHPDPMERTAQLENTEKTIISVRWVGELSWGDWHYLQVFNILIRKCLQLMDLQLLGRNYFDQKAQVNITDHKLCLWPGYFTSIRQYEKEIMMNAELTFKVMRTDNVYDLLLNTVDRNGQTDFAAFAKKVVGSVVLTFYNNRTYRIDDVDYDSSAESTFTTSSGQQISFKDYYRQKYNIAIQVPTQPLLVSKSKAHEIRAGMPEIVRLIPELCQLTGLSDDQRANFHLMSALSNHTRVGPLDRQNKLMEFVRKMTSNKEIMQEVRRWDLSIANNLVELQGRVLPQEKMRVGQDVCFPSGPKADWTVNLRNNAMIVSEPIGRMAVITPNNLAQETSKFLDVVNKAAEGMKWSTRANKIFTIPNDRSGSYLDKLEEVINQHNPSIIMCILQNKTADRYNAIKKKCCVDRGVPTQVVVARSMRSKGVMSIATKIAIQLNCKLGGAPWSVSIPMKGLMVVGYDVCRDTSNRSMSFGGMVASLNQACTRYYSSVAKHTYEEELSNNFGSFLLIACQKYKELNGYYPLKICIYRDGVGDGQIPLVMEHEIKNIIAKLEGEIYNAQNPLKMAFVIVSKRINTRIFQNKNNPPPGTVVDNTITLPERYDYYIVNQCVNQGTVAPTSFNVIHDNMGLTPDHMQMLTYKMCHMYYNWSGTVRVPAPCQYAHKLAFLTAQSLHRPANRRLETLLYYL